LDVRKGYPRLHRPDDRGPAQTFGAPARADEAQGITCNSVRQAKATHVAVFRSDLVQAGNRLKLIGLRWDGQDLVQI
jgi:hypothetical protein